MGIYLLCCETNMNSTRLLLYQQSYTISILAAHLVSRQQVPGKRRCRQRLTKGLPSPRTSDEVKWCFIWCKSKSAIVFGDCDISTKFKTPYPLLTSSAKSWFLEKSSDIQESPSAWRNWGDYSIFWTRSETHSNTGCVNAYQPMNYW